MDGLPMADIFLSYNREDLATAKRFAEGLEAEGLSVWWDVDLRSGEHYDKVTEQALKDAKAVVVLWSKRSVDSRWVRAEATMADRKGTLLPAMIEPCERPIMFELTHTADLTQWSGDTTHPLWRGFVDDARRFVGGEAASKARAAPAAPPPLPATPSIAVLPFANLSTDPEQDFFADGMVEEIVGALTRFKSIFVIAAGSTLSFKGQAVSAQEAGRRLGVRYVLEGSVRKAANRVRIAVKLVDAADGAQIWAHRFEDTLEDVFALQDSVALSAAGVIEPAVRRAETGRARARPTADMSSYELYLRALPLGWNLNKTDVTEALALLDRAIELDPSHARALAAAAGCHCQIVSFGWAEDWAEHRRLGLERAHRALQLAGDDPEILAWAAMVLLYMRDDLDAATTLIDRALALNPGHAFAWLTSGHLRNVLLKPDVAVEHFETALRLDPLSALRHWNLNGLGTARMFQQRYAEAVPLFREAIQLRSEAAINYAMLASCLGHLRQTTAAREALGRFESISGASVREWARWTRAEAPFLEGIALAEAEAPSETPAR